jgi:hypothetical protein
LNAGLVEAFYEGFQQLEWLPGMVLLGTATTVAVP